MQIRGTRFEIQQNAADLVQCRQAMDICQITCVNLAISECFRGSSVRSVMVTVMQIGPMGVGMGDRLVNVEVLV